MWILMEVPESTQSHVRLKQIELAIFTLCDGSFFYDMAADISAQVRVRRQITRSICRIGPIVGSGLPVGSTLVVSPTYELQHYKTNKMKCAQRTLRSTRAYAQSNQSSQCAWVAEDPVMRIHVNPPGSSGSLPEMQSNSSTPGSETEPPGCENTKKKKKKIFFFFFFFFQTIIFAHMYGNNGHLLLEGN